MRNNTATPPAAYKAHSIILTSRPSKSTSSISCPSAGFSKGSTARAGGGANIKKNTARPNITNSRIDIFCFILLGGVGGDDPLDRTNYCIRKQADREANERPLQAFLGFFHGLFVPAGNDISESIIYNKQDRRNSGDLQEPAHYGNEHGLKIVPPSGYRRDELVGIFVRRGKSQKLRRAGDNDEGQQRDDEPAHRPLQSPFGFLHGLLVAARDDQLEPAEHHKGYRYSADERGKSLHGFLYHGTRFSQTAQRVVERNRAGETRGERKREDKYGLDDEQYKKDFLHHVYQLWVLIRRGESTKAVSSGLVINSAISKFINHSRLKFQSCIMGLILASQGTIRIINQIIQTPGRIPRPRAAAAQNPVDEIGRASCRGRGEISV